jgi:NAD(P)-dependent dehydrogenase (short-subunit alcohol dehydrogenase family)
VVIHYHRSASQAAQLARQMTQLGVRAWTIQADLADAAQVEALAARSIEASGGVDILINNASFWPEDTIWDMTAQTLQTCMDVHVMAPVILARALARQQREGHIINILDTRVTDYDHKHISYHLAKRTLHTITRILALELAPRVAINAVAPGLILPPDGYGTEYLARLASTNPMNRYGQPEDVVEAVLFLLRSRFITGQVIYVDGGFHMRHQLYV